MFGSVSCEIQTDALTSVETWGVVLTMTRVRLAMTSGGGGGGGGALRLWVAGLLLCCYIGESGAAQTGRNAFSVL